uniref:Ovule protein n=1 Tax=Globodera rostochiensis TaxID=31243 RepID=A0A914GT60_GLORO
MPHHHSSSAKLHCWDDVPLAGFNSFKSCYDNFHPKYVLGIYLCPILYVQGCYFYANAYFFCELGTDLKLFYPNLYISRVYDMV